jgi:enoyl-CoA hydratase/carnithine racemase
LARRLHCNYENTTCSGEEAIYKLGHVPLEESIEHALDYQFAATRTQDHKESVEAFLEKRKPVFMGKV